MSILILASILAISIVFAGHTHNIQTNYFGHVTDSIDGDIPIFVTHSETVSGDPFAAANSVLISCWTDTLTGAPRPQCAEYNAERNVWESAPALANDAGTVTNLYALQPPLFVIELHTQLEYCPDTWQLLRGITPFTLLVCADPGSGPHIMAYLPIVGR